MADIWQYFVAPLIGYFFGAIPFAWISVKLVTGQDVRKGGSGSVSTRNTIRLAGWGWGVLNSALDVSKGFFAVFLVQFAFFPNFAQLNVLKALCGVGAFAGHCWMPWLKFQGGKGFAVLTGASIMINPWGVVIYWVSLPIWLLITRYSYLGGICGTASVALGYTIFYLTGATAWPHWSLMIYGWGCVILVILRMIPDFIAMRKGEIQRWKGLNISQWMR